MSDAPERRMIYADTPDQAPKVVWIQWSALYDSLGAFDHVLEDDFLRQPDLDHMPIRYVREDAAEVEALRNENKRLRNRERDLEAMVSSMEDQIVGAEAVLAERRPEKERLRKENERLREALHDAIVRPKRVVPGSADGFYSAEEADMAERRLASWEASRAALQGET